MKLLAFRAEGDDVGFLRLHLNSGHGGQHISVIDQGVFVEEGVGPQFDQLVHDQKLALELIRRMSRISAALAS